MKKRLVSVLLVLLLLFSAAPSVFAEGRDTDFFTERPHADLDFADMIYADVDQAAVLARMDAVRALAADAAHLEEVRAGFLTACEDYAMADTMATLAYILSTKNAADTAAGETYTRAEQTRVALEDALYLLARDILNSPCAAALDGILNDADREMLMTYQAMTEEQKELLRREDELATAYWNLSVSEFTYTEDGRTWTLEDAIEAYWADEIDFNTVLRIYDGIVQEEHRQLGELYLELVSLRRDLAATYGYNSYADYAYRELYGRDYTPEETLAFQQGVKEHIVPLFLDLGELYSDDAERNVFWEDYSGDTALDLMEPCLAQMSDELLESFTYMREHHLYDNGYGDSKGNTGYTTLLASYGAPFFFDDPGGGLGDLTTAIHESGHYNNFYWTDSGWDVSSVSIDVAEVHSQALELLFTHWYPDLFGEAGEAVETWHLYQLTGALVQGAMIDELEQYVYDAEDPTVEDVDSAYLTLAVEYGILDESVLDEYADPEDAYVWTDIHHLYTAPCYYISYATSAAGAFAFWLESREDYFGAVDDYLRFTALGTDCSFQESFRAVGAASPLSGDYLRSLAAALRTGLDVDARLADRPVVGMFRDVKADSWYVNAVSFVYNMGLFEGVSETSFAPDLPMTRAMAVTVFWRLNGRPRAEEAGAAYADVQTGSWYADAVDWAGETGLASGYGNGLFGVDDPITREQLAVMLWRSAGCPEARLDLSRTFADADQISPWAEDAVRWAVSSEVLNGMGDGTMSPGSSATRAQVAQMLLRYTAWLIMNALSGMGQ